MAFMRKEIGQQIVPVQITQGEQVCNLPPDRLE